MNLYDYEIKYFSTYKAFAETVKFILEQAFLAAANLPRPQSIQCRAKSVESLRRRLSEHDKVDTQTLERDRHDLAGVRLIFYGNSDVNRFVSSPLIHENFEIEEGLTKIHHPQSGNQGSQYRAVHYTVRLREDRLCLPEYKRFAGLRCEIQVQTILEHAWAETSHDILYKNTLGDGYGGEAMKGIERRFARIMDKYLIPAGYEFQKAKQDYERLLQGKELFDKDVAKLLDNALNNNERYEILSVLKDYAIPHYDDLSAAYKELQGPLLRVVRAARATKPVPIKTTVGEMEGFLTAMVIELVVEIIQNLRYVDPVGTLQLLSDIYKEETNEDIRQQTMNVVKQLSEYNIEAYNQVGPTLQMALLEHLAGISDVEVDKIRPLALTVWSEAIQSEITGTTWKANSVVLSRGAVPASDQLREVRDKAMKAIFSAYDRSTDDVQKRAILSSLDDATRTPHQGQYSNELLATTLRDATRIVTFMAERIEMTSYALLQHLEHRFFYQFLWAKGFLSDPESRFGCQAEAQALRAAICQFRDTINADERFVRYKVLVGFESVYSEHWIDEEFNYETDEYRHRETDRYIDEIGVENEREWFNLIECCADTKSNDGATFPVFDKFISKLAEKKPEVADRLLTEASDDLRRFLPSILNGLALSGRDDLYKQIFENEIRSARSLAGLAWHLRRSGINKPDFAACLLKRAIEKGDQRAVVDCLLFAFEHYETERVTDGDTFVRDALAFLNDRKEVRWVFEARFLKRATRLYEKVSPEIFSLLLQNLGYLRKVDHRAEWVLARLAEREPAAVWDYFGTRLIRDATESEQGDDEQRFEAVPYQFHGLEKELLKNPQLALSKALSWFVEKPELFRFRGGRLISITFPNCPSEFASAVAELVKNGGEREANFALAILQNYEGQSSIHVVLREIVSRFPDDPQKLNKVKISIESTGVVSGEFGRAEALLARKESLTEWLTDDRQAVKAFAERYIAELDLMIAFERRRAETSSEMRRRSYDEVEDGEKSAD